jgi:hypothetical protein
MSCGQFEQVLYVCKRSGSTYANGTNKEGMKRARTDSRGEYQIWRELLVGDSASPESGTQRSVRH